MCSVCRRNPCAAGCPNAEEPKPIHICKECGYGIYEGDHYYDGPDGYYCEECLEDMSVKELVELLGDELKTYGNERITGKSNTETGCGAVEL